MLAPAATAGEAGGTSLGIPTQPKTSRLAVASFVMAFLPLLNCIGFTLGIVALVQIGNNAKRLKGSGFATGGLVISVLITMVSILASMMLPTLARAKDKAKRIMCVNNLQHIGRAGRAFAKDNGERLPWQLTPSGVRAHLDSISTPSSEYGRQTNNQLNEVKAHPSSFAAAGVYGLTAMKAKFVVPNILHSPCDPDRLHANRIVKGKWMSCDTMASGVSGELGEGASYILVRGADTQRPSSVYALTRNWSADSLNTGKWLGSDSDPGNERTMAGLTASQGNISMMDGSARQATNADFQMSGTYTKAAQTATGGVARGRTSLNLIRGTGL